MAVFFFLPQPSSCPQSVDYIGLKSSLPISLRMQRVLTFMRSPKLAHFLLTYPVYDINWTVTARAGKLLNVKCAGLYTYCIIINIACSTYVNSRRASAHDLFHGTCSVKKIYNSSQSTLR